MKPFGVSASWDVSMVAVKQAGRLFYDFLSRKVAVS